MFHAVEKECASEQQSVASRVSRSILFKLNQLVFIAFPRTIPYMWKVHIGLLVFSKYSMVSVDVES